MTSTDIDIAEHLLALCIEAGHKPGKVQFTKYLYLLDYCHWHYTGLKATSLPWKFYHYGPWCDEAEDCMGALARRYSFGWREAEASVIHSVDVAKPKVAVLVSGLINRIVDLFKDKDLNVLLDVAYFQTEPMVQAERGDLLDFRAIPTTKSFPQFFPEPAKPTPYVLPARIRQRMEALKAKAPQLKAKFRKQEAYRNSPEYRQAMELLRKDLSSEEPIPEIKVTFTPEAVEGLSRA